MICNHCNSELPEGADVCPNCGAPVEPSPHRASRLTWLKPAIVAALVAVVVAAALVYYWSSRPVLMTALVPAGVQGAGEVDAPWLWDSLKDTRNSAAGKRLVAQFQEAYGISIDRDIIPWVGNIGVASLGSDRSGENVAVYLEIRDRDKFSDRLNSLQSRIEEKTKTKWTAWRYRGVGVRQANYSAYGRQHIVAACVLRNWCVITTGRLTIENVINTYQGRIKAAARDEQWSRALEMLPEKANGWMAIDSRPVYRAADMGDSGVGTMLKTENLPAHVTATAVTDGGGQVRIDSVSIPVSASLERDLKQMASQVKPLDASALRRLPGGAFAVTLGSNPSAWWTYAKIQVMKSARQGAEADSYARLLKDYKPLDDVLTACTGQTAAAVAWKKASGFGVVALSNTAGARQASQSDQTLRSLALKFKEPVRVKDGFATLPESTMHDRHLNLLVSWTADGSWFEVASNPMWMKPASSPASALPQEASGACFAVVGNLHFLPAFLDELEQDDRTVGIREISGHVRKLGLERVEWQGWTKIDSDGRAVRSSLVLKSLDWRRIISTIGDEATVTKTF